MTDTSLNPVSISDPATQDAVDIINSLLQRWGLSTLGSWAWDQITTGASPSQVTLNMYDQPAFQARFPAIKQLQSRGLTPPSPEQYLSTEQSYRQVFNSYGLSDYYGNQDHITSLIVGDTSPQELSDRLALHATDAFNAATHPANSSASTYLNQFYGIGAGSGDLLAYYLNDKIALPVLQQREATANIAATSAQTGYGSLDQSTAERLSAQGVTQSAAQNAFSTLAAERQLFNNLPGEQGTAITQPEQIGAAFEGLTGAQLRIAKKAAKRKAEFGASSGSGGTNTGVSGLGSTTR